MIGAVKKLLLLPHIRVHNANALSSPYTIGFPAMTAWLGATHALQRKLHEKSFAVSFNATGVVCHQLELQTYKGTGDFVSSIISTGNPLDKTGARPAFIEEARCHLDISLLIEISGLDKEHEDTFLELTTHLLNNGIKIAGGDIKTFHRPEIMLSEYGNKKDRNKIVRKLMPGYAIIERRELMLDAMNQGQDGLDALLDYLAIHHHCEQDEDGKVTWQSHRKTYQDKPPGWIVPIATGFQAISDIGTAKNQRDPDTPHRFAESIVTLGEFKILHRFQNIDDILWRYYFDKENDLYLCQQSSQEQKETVNDFIKPQDSIAHEFE